MARKLFWTSIFSVTLNMSVSNASYCNNSALHQTLIQEENWRGRLQEHWPYLASYASCIGLCLLVIGISIFNKKHINDDYKWFILNQAISSFICASGLLLFYCVINVYLGPTEFRRLYICAKTPLWLTVLLEITVQELQVKFGEYAQYTTLLATVFNRWIAVALPYHYPSIMSPRLIFLYCSLCYLLLLPIDLRLFKFLSFSESLTSYLIVGPFIVPWFLCIILSSSILFMLWKRLRTTENILDKRALKENRKVLYVVMIQIAVSLFDKVPQYVILIGRGFNRIPNDVLYNNWFFVFLAKIRVFNSYFSNAYTCFVILFTMPPYRKALLSLFTPAAKFCKRSQNRVDLAIW